MPSWPDDGGYAGVVRRLDVADENVVHGARLAQHGDDSIEEGDGDDQDADKRLVCVFHNDKTIFQGCQD
jgi:hypothetical protein